MLQAIDKTIEFMVCGAFRDDFDAPRPLSAAVGRFN
jgi:hypothetical protein